MPHIHGIISFEEVHSSSEKINFTIVLICSSEYFAHKFMLTSKLLDRTKCVIHIQDIKKITVIVMSICILKWWNAWICKCLVLICHVKQKPLPPVSRKVVKVVTVKMVVSVSCIRVAFVLSCKDRRWPLSSVKPVCYSSAYFHHCASSWWFSVCLCWTVFVIWVLLHHSPPPTVRRERGW